MIPLQYVQLYTRYCEEYFLRRIRHSFYVHRVDHLSRKMIHTTIALTKYCIIIVILNEAYSKCQKEAELEGTSVQARVDYLPMEIFTKYFSVQQNPLLLLRNDLRYCTQNF